MKIIILILFLFFANCVTFDDSVAEGRKQCKSLFNSIKLKRNSEGAKIAYSDCVAKMANGNEEYNQAGALRGIYMGVLGIYFFLMFADVRDSIKGK